MFDGATFIGPLNHIVGGDEPEEWNGKGGPNYFHDKAYYERDKRGRKWVDDKWLELMLLAAAGLIGSDPERAELLRKEAITRHVFVRAFGGLWWHT